MGMWHIQLWHLLKRNTAYAAFYSDLINICFVCSKILVTSVALSVFHSSLRAVNLFLYELKGSKLKKDSVSQVRCRQALFFLSFSILSHSFSLCIFCLSMHHVQFETLKCCWPHTWHKCPLVLHLTVQIHFLLFTVAALRSKAFWIQIRSVTFQREQKCVADKPA